MTTTSGKKLVKDRQLETELVSGGGNLADAIRRVKVSPEDISYDDLAHMALDLALDFDSNGGDVYKGKIQLDAIRLVLDVKKEKDKPAAGEGDGDDFDNWKVTIQREK